MVSISINAVPEYVTVLNCVLAAVVPLAATARTKILSEDGDVTGTWLNPANEAPPTVDAEATTTGAGTVTPR